MNKNAVLLQAISLGGSRVTEQFDQVRPETVLLGYAKLLLMNKVNKGSAEALIGPGWNEDLEAAWNWFQDKHLDLVLIRGGLGIVIHCFPDSSMNDGGVKYFQHYLESTSPEESSEEILDRAEFTAFSDFGKLFTKGSDINAVFSYVEEISQKKREEEQKADEQNPGDDAPENLEPAPGDDKPAPEDDKPAPGDDKPALGDDKPAPGDDEPETDESSVNITDIVNAMFSSSGKKEEKKASSEEKKKGDSKEGLLALSEKYSNLTTRLLDKVKGQEHAILKFVQGYNQGELLEQAGGKTLPRSYFFFFGPPGVGKTYLAETTAEALGIPVKIFNMSEYSEESAVQELLGTSRNWREPKEGLITQFVLDHSECLLVFDEVEKADIHVIRLFLQILGSGRLHSPYSDKDVTFEHTTIIFTSNVGRELYEDRSVNLTTLPEKVLIDSIQKEKNPMGHPALPPELCSRIAAGNTVLFNHLSVRYLVELVRDNFDRIAADMQKQYGVKITYSPYLPQLFIYNRGGEIDARVAAGQSGRFLKNEIYEILRQIENSKNPVKQITSIDIDIEWSSMDPELKGLFFNEEKADLLMFAEDISLCCQAAGNEKYHIIATANLEEARTILKKMDISAAFIDPFQGKTEDNEKILSIADYNTEGVQLFHELAETSSDLPIYLLEKQHKFSEVDNRTFLQEGAAGTVKMSEDDPESFSDHFRRILEDLYMEKESRQFNQRGWVIAFGTKQEIDENEGRVRSLYYGLKKRMAVDVESRGAILSAVERPKVKFEDVIGAKDAKEELKYFLDYLKNPKHFLMNGGKPPKGILLYGPPGTGKTMLARAMAGESDVTFLQTSAAEFMNKYQGESEANIRRLFQRAKKYAPAIIFIDEIDAIGKKRTGSEFAHTTENMLNTLLTEMDGFSSASAARPVFVLAATNFGVRESDSGISGLDEALIRRFDNKIFVDLPNEEERRQYLKRMLVKRQNVDITDDVISNVAERTTGQSLAIIQNVIELAEREAKKANSPLTGRYLLNALEDYIYGQKKEFTPDYYRSVAIHETGHALVSYLSGDQPSYITIESRGDHGGYMQHANPEEVPQYSREDLLARIRTALAGRAAEQVFFGKNASLNTGASSDLEHATSLAFHMLCSFGMVEDQLIVLPREEIMKSPLACDYIRKVNTILQTEMAATIRIIEEHREKVQKIADVLVRENRLTGEQFRRLMD